MRKNLKTSKRLSYSALAICILFSAHTPNNARADSAFGNASVTIREAIQITEAQNMQFGIVIVKPSDNDIITLSTDGTLSSNGNVEYKGGNQRSGQFSMAGTPNTNLSITFENALLTGAGDSLSLENFVHDAGSSPAFDSSGALIINVGADLHLNTAQASGNYAGQYQLSVNYP